MSGRLDPAAGRPGRGKGLRQPEKVMYLWTLPAHGPGPDYPSVIDVNLASATYGKILKRVEVGSAGNEAHHMGFTDDRTKIWAASLTYTRCTAACPLLTARMARLPRALGRDAARVRLLSITVDPARDSANALAAYARRFAADGRRWFFLREDPTRLAPVLTESDAWVRPAADGEIDHPARLYSIDGAGRAREIYGLEFFDERPVLLDIRALLREGYSER